MPILQTQPTKDLAAARAKASFPVQELTRYIHGSDAKIARRREIASIVSSDPVFSSNRYSEHPSLEHRFGWTMFLFAFCHLCTHFFISSPFEIDRSSAELA